MFGSNYDSIYLGESPCDEPCQQCGTDTYDSFMAKAECRALINQIRRIVGDEPAGVRFKVVPQQHDFGTYYSAEVYYNPNDEQATEYAFLCEEKYPEHWDKLALKELREAIARHPGATISRITRITLGDVLRHKNSNWNSIDTSHD